MEKQEKQQRVVLLHGLGQGPESWRAAAERMQGVSAAALDLSAMLAGRAEYQALRDALFAALDAEQEPLHLCGLSLGGVLALDYAAHRPERMASLVLIGTPYAVPRRLLKLQDVLFALMPRRSFAGMGLTKQQVRGLAASMAEVDIPALLPRVRCRVLVLCGAKDRANRRAAEQLQGRLANASLQWVAGAGHEVNREAPAALAALLTAFYRAGQDAQRSL